MSLLNIIVAEEEEDDLPWRLRNSSSSSEISALKAAVAAAVHCDLVDLFLRIGIQTHAPPQTNRTMKRMENALRRRRRRRTKKMRKEKHQLCKNKKMPLWEKEGEGQGTVEK
mmetsp:Transcript_25517/g.35441  ORF Transcript_25517/g.35441 Transcript_25517/m.35441 type:complete len:112 (-) Transcript_25517:27-362(-)